MKNEEVSSKYAEDWLPIKGIANGMIQTDKNEYVTGVKITPKNIFILDEGMQNSILSNLRYGMVTDTMQNSILSSLGNFYNTIDYEFWLLIADRPVDIGVYLSKLQIQYSNTNDAGMRKLIMQDIDKANMFMSEAYNIVDTEYFMLFKEKKMEVVQKRIHNLISGLASVGLSSSQTSNNDLRIIIDNYLNDGEQVNFRTVI